MRTHMLRRPGPLPLGLGVVALGSFVWCAVLVDVGSLAVGRGTVVARAMQLVHAQCVLSCCLMYAFYVA